MLKAIKIRVYLTESQRVKLPQMFGNACFVYNYLLNLQRFRYRHHLKYLSKFDMNKLLPKLKRKRKYQWLKRTESTSLQMASAHLNQAYQNFFAHRAKLPKFKKRSHNQSYTSNFVNNNIRVINKHELKLPKLGFVRCINIRKFNGQIKHATVEVKSTGKYVVLTIDTKAKLIAKTDLKIGIDLGLRNFANLSNGLKTKPLHFNDLEHQLKIWQRKFARRRINAKRIEAQINHENQKRLIPVENPAWYLHYRVIEACQMIAKIHAKITNRRLDFLQKLSSRLVKQYDVIVIEDLKTKNLLHNHNLARIIGQQGWRLFREMLSYKCQWYGKELQIVNPANTTQTCNQCGYQMNQRGHKIKLGVENWTCTQCNAKHDRDHNAAINILRAAIN